MSSYLRSSSLLVAAVSVATAYASPLSTYSGSFRAAPAFNIAPLHEAQAIHGHVNNSYIVTMKSDMPEHVMGNHMNFLQAAHASDPLLDSEHSGVKHVYDSHVMRGYAGHFTDDVVSQIRSMPEVEMVERDQIMKTTDIGVQKGAPWVSSCA